MAQTFTKKLFILAGCLLLAFVPSLAGIITRPDAWYFGLTKPPLNPPPWVFAPAWTLLYTLMGVAHFLYSTTASPGAGDHRKAAGHTVYGVQLALNGAWSLIFFGARNPFLAGIEILILLAFIIATIRVFGRTSKPAAWLLAPYVLWVSFASYLNWGIWWLNRGS